MHEHDEDPIERLRAADPAADLEPRGTFADEVVAAATREHAVADLGAQRARRAPRRALAPTVVAASIAAALAIGGVAGFGFAQRGETIAGMSSTDDSGASDGGAAPPLSLGGEGGTGDLAAQSESASDSGATSRSADSSYPSSSRSAFRSSVLLSTSGGARAAAYAYDAASGDTIDEIAALAAALGVDGTPEVRDGAWMVGPGDGGAPSLGVTLDGTLSFWYGSGADPWACGDACTPPEEAAAVTAARDLLARMGRDPNAFEYTSESWEGSAARSVSAWPVVDGQRIDQPWSITCTADGITDVFGTAADIVRSGEYEVVSEQEAMARLSDPRFGARLTTLPAPAEAATEEWTPPTAASELPSPGGAISWGVNDVEIVSVRLGVASHRQADGAALLVPTYEFTDALGGTWSVIAVVESALDFTAEDQTPSGWIE